MAIHHPGSRAGSGVALKSIRESIIHGGGKGIFATLNVVPMIDLFTMLVLFLIAQFSAAGELMMMNPNVAMPKASAHVELARAPMVALTKTDSNSPGDLLFENQRLMSLADVNEVKYPDWDIKPLGMVLDCFMDSNKGAVGTDCWRNSAWGAQQKASNDKQKSNRKIIIQSDRTVPFKIVKMVMATCGRHQFREPNFAVMVSGKGDDSTGDKGAPGSTAE